MTAVWRPGFKMQDSNILNVIEFSIWNLESGVFAPQGAPRRWEDAMTAIDQPM